jgi:hypothetical protein
MLHLSTWETQEMLEELLRENVKKWDNLRDLVVNVVTTSREEISWGA